MGNIKSIVAREILDSRGIPTLEGILTTDKGNQVVSQIPSGESLGSYEGIELRDQDPKRFNGMGVTVAVNYINNAINKKLSGISVEKHIEIDRWLKSADGTENNRKLGVNTIMLVSQLAIKAAAAEKKVPLYKYIFSVYKAIHKDTEEIKTMPSPIYNLLNGGKHGTKNLDFQEFHIVPSTSVRFSQSLEFAVVVYNGLKQLFAARNADVSVSEEGGFTPNLFTNTEAFEIIKEVLLAKRLKMGVEVFTGADCAPAYYYKNHHYHMRDKANPLNTKEYMEFLIEMVSAYNILILEDPLHEDDMEGWKELMKQIGKQIYIVGDDFIAGNLERLKKAIENEACNAVLIKFNQVGTITEMLELSAAVKKAGMKLIVSQRLGETVDDMIADFSVGVQADFVKFGAPARGERIAKYNRLLAIEKELSL